MIPAAAYIAGLAARLFVLGVAAFFDKKDLLTQFMPVEIMLNAGNLAFLALAPGGGRATAQAVVLFVVTVAAAEAVVGLGSPRRTPKKFMQSLGSWPRTVL